MSVTVDKWTVVTGESGRGCVGVRHNIDLLDRVIQRLEPMRTVPAPPQQSGRQAAVLLALTREPEPHVILTRRADHMNSHRGEVAFPGGMWEPGDGDLLKTALRESWEEVSLPPEMVDFQGQLPYRRTRNGIGVTPFVGVIPRQVELIPNPDELDSIFTVPLTFFLDQGNCHTFPLAYEGRERWFPCYDYENYRVWGMTLHVLMDFLNITLDANIQLPFPETLDELQLVDPT